MSLDNVSKYGNDPNSKTYLALVPDPRWSAWRGVVAWTTHVAAGNPKFHCEKIENHIWVGKETAECSNVRLLDRDDSMIAGLSLAGAILYRHRTTTPQVLSVDSYFGLRISSFAAKSH